MNACVFVSYGLLKTVIFARETSLHLNEHVVVYDRFFLILKIRKYGKMSFFPFEDVSLFPAYHAKVGGLFFLKDFFQKVKIM